MEFQMKSIRSIRNLSAGNFHKYTNTKTNEYPYAHSVCLKIAWAKDILYCIYKISK